MPTLVTFVERHQSGGYPLEGLNVLFYNFLAKYNTTKLNTVSNDEIWLRLFPFSLKDRAIDWLQNEAPDSFMT